MDQGVEHDPDPHCLEVGLERLDAASCCHASGRSLDSPENRAHVALIRSGALRVWRPYHFGKVFSDAPERTVPTKKPKRGRPRLLTPEGAKPVRESTGKSLIGQHRGGSTGHGPPGCCLI